LHQHTHASPAHLLYELNPTQRWQMLRRALFWPLTVSHPPAVPAMGRRTHRSRSHFLMVASPSIWDLPAAFPHTGQNGWWIFSANCVIFGVFRHSFKVRNLAGWVLTRGRLVAEVWNPQCIAQLLVSWCFKRWWGQACDAPANGAGTANVKEGVCWQRSVSDCKIMWRRAEPQPFKHMHTPQPSTKATNMQPPRSKISSPPGTGQQLACPPNLMPAGLNTLNLAFHQPSPHRRSSAMDVGKQMREQTSPRE